MASEPIPTTPTGTEQTQSPPDTPEESQDLAHLLRLPKPVRHCCEASLFFLVTLVFLADMVTDVWVMTIYGSQHHLAFLGMAIFSVVGCGLVCTLMYAIQMRTEGTQRAPVMYGCMLLNFPLQLGIVSHRLLYSVKKCNHCLTQMNEQSTRSTSTQEWIFTKLKLLHGMFQSTPQLMINMLHMLVYRNVHYIQYISAVVSFVSLLFGTVFHEKVRKEKLRGHKFGASSLVCITLYKVFILASRILALTSFIYYFGVWLGALLLPHFVVLMTFYTYLYRQIWKVQYYKIVLHSLFGLMAYFPMHSEYRPEGETVMFYVLFTIENILMVCLPYGHEPAHPINPIYRAGAKYHTAMTLTVLVSTGLGLIFMVIYYFFFHKSKHTIRHTHLGWLAHLCEWTNKPQLIQDLPRDQRDDVRLYVDDGELSAKLPSEEDRLTAAEQQPTSTTRHRSQVVEDGRPAKVFLPALSSELDVDQSLLEGEEDGVKYGDPTLGQGMGPSLELLSGDELQGEILEASRARPSVLEGDDEDSEEEPTRDRRPLRTPIVV